jgi:very-short-patch-repair endonuclease
MTELLNKSFLKNRRRELRSTETSYEKILWSELRNNKLGVKFRRQFSVGGYIFDFCCPRKRLGIEVDGGIHNSVEQKKYDRVRDKLSKELGFTILRFKNSEIENNKSKVIKIIMATIKKLPSTYEGEGQGVRCAESGII